MYVCVSACVCRFYCRWPQLDDGSIYLTVFSRNTHKKQEGNVYVYIYIYILDDTTPYDRVLVSAIGVCMLDVHGVCSMQCLLVFLLLLCCPATRDTISHIIHNFNLFIRIMYLKRNSCSNRIITACDGHIQERQRRHT